MSLMEKCPYKALRPMDLPASSQSVAWMTVGEPGDDARRFSVQSGRCFIVGANVSGERFESDETASIRQDDPVADRHGLFL